VFTEPGPEGTPARERSPVTDLPQIGYAPAGR
jgi:hypothetical protein